MKFENIENSEAIVHGTLRMFISWNETVMHYHQNNSCARGMESFSGLKFGVANLGPCMIGRVKGYQKKGSTRLAHSNGGTRLCTSRLEKRSFKKLYDIVDI